MTPAEQVAAITSGALDALHQAHAADEPPPIEVDEDGVLHGANVLPYVPSARRQGLAPGLTHADGFVWHFTDTRSCGAANLQRRIVAPPKPGERAASWSAVIDRAGKLAQSVDAHHGSWHAGGSSAALFEKLNDGTWRPSISSSVPRWGANSWSYGVELENVGEVRKVGGEWLGWPFAHGTKWGEPERVPEAEVVVIDPAHADRGWHEFTPEQVDTAKQLGRAMVHAYGWLRANCRWGHCQIDPQRRTDPGPLWMGTETRRGHVDDVIAFAFGLP